MREAAEHRVRRFGEYTLGRCIGTGGMASVYAARQLTSLGVARMVALKILHPTVAPDSEHKDSFRREASLSTRLEHPGIVRTYDVGAHDGQLYMAMELLQGVTLSSLRDVAVPLPVALRILDDVGLALHYAHELRALDGEDLGLVHQDVTPQNILVGYDGRVRLLDFGVARLASVDASRTEHVRGKPAYLAPEQIEGSRLDRRVDVFALGIVAHELVTGQRLFRRDGVNATYRAVLVDPIPDVRATRPDVPEGIGAAIARALLRDLDARWPTVDAFRAALAEARVRAGIPALDPPALATWARAAAPPEWSASDLEREILELREAGEPGGSGIADRPTLPPGQVGRTLATIKDSPEASGGDPLPLQPRRQGAFLGTAILAAVAATVAGFALRSTPARPPPAPPAASSVAPPPFPPPGEVDPAREPAPPGEAPASASASRPPRPPSRTHERPAPAPTIAASVPAPEPPPPPSTPASPAPGHVSVWSNVWGHVDIDGRSVGDSPVTREPVAPGKHTVHIVTERGEQTRAAVVDPDVDTRIRFTF